MTCGPRQRSPGRTRLSGVPRGSWLQRSASPEKEGDRVLFTDRWCTGLSGAPTDRRQLLPSKWSSNGSYLPWGYKRDPKAHGTVHQAPLEHPKTLKLRKHAFDSLCLRFEHLSEMWTCCTMLCACFSTCVRVVAVTLALACVSIPSLTLVV
jgi:hypothetical protein